MTDDEKARVEQARRLREEIERRTKQKPGTSPPQTPREFVEERMRDLAKEPTEESEDDTGEGPKQPPRRDSPGPDSPDEDHL